MAWFYFQLTITWPFSYGHAWQKISNRKKYTSFASRFDGQADQAVQCQAHHPMQHVQGYLRSHWAPPLGKYLPLAPADAMVINFGIKNWVVALWNRCSKASVKKAQNKPSTQLIKVTSCLERSNTTIKAKELSYFFSYQMLKMDKIWWSY